ncbi:hypothetical protein GCM10010912_16770 [Paenibacillus albidus]|uniref:Uncharacterized protein n=1 Tax=Paenibacillus albidus TaxID=2041023 RepID=A0A917FEQ0_9BACL|nr:hypothetical protein [Paenibacillus albidus]GGF72294.1 hypothetical protein GCM10010912_16770 [Paenibacillus albidus]
MANFKNLLNIQQCITEKREDIEIIKQKRRVLFNNVAANEDEIIALHYEIEFKKLELLHIKREQITVLRDSSDVYDRTIYLQQLGRLQNVNEKCISILVKRLFEEGYGMELKKRGFIPEHRPEKPANQMKVI